MDYEKKYKEALAKARHYYLTGKGEPVDFIKMIFPEFAESEDEKIKKHIISVLEDCWQTCKNIDYDSSRIQEDIAWLEKQGEKKPVVIIPKFRIGDNIKTTNEEPLTITKIDGKGYWSEDLLVCDFDDAAKWKLVEQKPADKVEPKFHEGDFIKHNKANIICKVISVNSGSYYVENIETSGRIELFNARQNFHLWTIQDAKNGDVLCCESGWTCIFNTLNSDNISFSSYCFMDSTGWFCETGSESHTLEKAFIKAYNGNIYPATKEQCDLLFQKMHEAGYEWDDEKKELKKIENHPILSDFFNAEYERGKADALKCVGWSEEDNKWIENLIQTFEDGYFEGFNQLKSYGVIDWLKSLKERIGG